MRSLLYAVGSDSCGLDWIMLKHVRPSDPSHCAPEKKKSAWLGSRRTYRHMNDCFMTFQSKIDSKEYHCHTSK